MRRKRRPAPPAPQALTLPTATLVAEPRTAATAADPSDAVLRFISPLRTGTVHISVGSKPHRLNADVAVEILSGGAAWFAMADHPTVTRCGKRAFPQFGERCEAAGRLADEQFGGACFRTLMPEVQERAFEHGQPEVTGEWPRTAGLRHIDRSPRHARPCSPLPDRRRCRRCVRGRCMGLAPFQCRGRGRRIPGFSPEHQAALQSVEDRTAPQFTYWPDLPTAMQAAHDERVLDTAVPRPPTP